MKNKLYIWITIAVFVATLVSLHPSAKSLAVELQFGGVVTVQTK